MDARQVMEVEAFSRIEPIGSEFSPVSRPPVKAIDPSERRRMLKAWLPAGKKA